MNNILINDQFKFINKQNTKLIKEMTKYIFEKENISKDVFFELNIVDLKKIQEINSQYRNKNKPTDVISFSFWDSQNSFKTNLMGEIFLCKEKVIEQANLYNHSFNRELMFLISHGIYHLLGYDHITKQDEEIMMNKQYDVLKFLNIE